MIVYESDVRGFRNDVLSNRIEERIHELFHVKLRRKTSRSEVGSWKNSLAYMDRVLADDSIPQDAGVAIEFQIPGRSNRIDFVLTGLNSKSKKTAVIIELKQWASAEMTTKDAVVRTLIGGRMQEMNHPSYQAWSYASLLSDYNAAVQDIPIELRPCAYLHNCESDSTIRDLAYQLHTDKAPAFLRDDAELLRDFIRTNVRFGDRGTLLFEILNGKLRPSKNLADSLASLLKGKPEFILIDDQKIIFETALDLAKQAQSGPKQVLIVEGGPGTGKSVVAINLLVRFTQGKLVAKYITRNAAPRAVYEAKLTGTLRKTNISNLFGGPGSFIDAELDTYGALIVDEAHRLNEKSGLYGNLGENQIKHLIDAARCSIFFIDDAQRVTLKDIGGVEAIEQWAQRLGAKTTKMRLASQFRCNGSDGYIGWVDNTLGIRETANVSLDGVEFDFKVCDSANQLRKLIFEKNKEANKARMVAGYCWRWKSKKNRLAMDIELPAENFSAQWNLEEDGGTWIMRPASVEQIGCIHTCQGLEVDYIGVIIGHDLVIRNGQWCEFPERRAREDSSIRGHGKLLLLDPADGERRIREVIRNTYRTLMTRGARGCYVYSVDPETNQFIRAAVGRVTPIEVQPDITIQVPALPFRKLTPAEFSDAKNRVRYFPSIIAAAGGFSNAQMHDEGEWVELPDTFRARPDMFIVKVVGESMNRRISNGAWCLFQHNPTGSRNGKIVLAQHRSIQDPDGHGQYTVKRYSSQKNKLGDTWMHRTVLLSPDSFDRTYLPICITTAEEGEFVVVGEFLAVIE